MNYPQGACDEQIFEPKSVYFFKALRHFRNYDVIIDTDRLFSDEQGRYAAGLERWFGQEGLRSKNAPMYCQRPSRNANRNFPLQVDNATGKLLYQKNQADYELYNELISCRTGSNHVFFPVGKSNVGGEKGPNRQADLVATAAAVKKS